MSGGAGVPALGRAQDGAALGDERLTFLNRTLCGGVPLPPLEIEIEA